MGERVAAVEQCQADAVREALKLVEPGGAVHVFGPPEGGVVVGMAYFCKGGRAWDAARVHGVEVVYHFEFRVVGAQGGVAEVECVSCGHST